MVPAAGNVPLSINLSGLVPVRCQVDRSRIPEVAAALDRRDQGRFGDGSDTRNRNSCFKAVVLAGFFGDGTGRRGCLPARRVSGSMRRQQDCARFRLTNAKAAHQPVQDDVLACRRLPFKGLHEASDIIGKIGCDPDETVLGAGQIPGKHSVKAQHPHVAAQARFGQMCQTLRISLVRHPIEGLRGMSGIEADHRQLFGTKGENEPNRQRVASACDPFRCRRNRRRVGRIFPPQTRWPSRRTGKLASLIATCRPIDSFRAVLNQMPGRGVRSGVCNFMPSANCDSPRPFEPQEDAPAIALCRVIDRISPRRPGPPAGVFGPK